MTFIVEWVYAEQNSNFQETKMERWIQITNMHILQLGSLKLLTSNWQWFLFTADDKQCTCCVYFHRYGTVQVTNS